jgi:hypothetical protein
MKFYNSNFIFIITTSGKNIKNLSKVLYSLKNQSVTPKKIIISSFKKIKKFENCKIFYSKIANQVYQRCQVIKKIKKNDKTILVFLDDKIILQQDCLINLIQEWNCAKKNIAGIGFSCTNYNPQKISWFHKISYTNISSPGKILKNGFVSGYGNLKKNIHVDWLNGGMTSWRYSYVKNFLGVRNFPKISWSVGEDLIFSFNIRKKFKLIVSSKCKSKILQTSTSMNLLEYFKKGFFHSFIIRSFIQKNNKEFSLFLFFYSILISSFFGVIINLILFRINHASRFLGRLFGSLFYYKNIS